MTALAPCNQEVHRGLSCHLVMLRTTGWGQHVTSPPLQATMLVLHGMHVSDVKGWRRSCMLPVRVTGPLFVAPAADAGARVGARGELPAGADRRLRADAGGAAGHEQRAARARALPGRRRGPGARAPRVAFGPCMCRGQHPTASPAASCHSAGHGTHLPGLNRASALSCRL